jgi:hypothetical protein
MEVVSGGFPLGVVIGAVVMVLVAAALITWAIRTTARPK